MIKRIFLLVGMLITTAVYAQTTDQIVNDVMQAYLKKHDVPGAAVIVYVDGKPESYYFGYANFAAKQPVTKDTIFELGSITKVMTSLLLAQEVDFAKIKLKESITKYIPSLPASFSTITVESLATHTSGLPFELPENIKNRAEWEKFAADWKPSSPVNAEYTYSNVGMGLLGQALEAVSHQNFNTLYRQKILTPLAMQPIGLTVPAKLKAFYAQGYNVDGDMTAPVQEGLFPSAWAIKASVQDMGKFLSAAIGLSQTPESIFYPMLMTQTSYVQIGDTEQALGWQVHEISTSEQIQLLLKGKDVLGLRSHPVSEVFADTKFNGDELIDKTGATAGFRDYIAVIPSKKTGIVILTNRFIASNDTMIAGREILFRINGLK